MKNIDQLSEEEIISLFNVINPVPPLLKGIGDDCAVLGLFGDEVFVWTADLLTEDVHFTLENIEPQNLGYKSLAVNLSDIAAMGAKPVAATLSLALPATTSVEWLKGFRDGFVDAAKEFTCQIAGGDTTTSIKSIMISVSVIGKAKQENLLLRSNASPDEDIWISGIPGMSATGFEVLKTGGKPSNEQLTAAVKRHIYPVPRCELGYILGTQKLAASAIDTSDGISQDLLRICKASGVGAELDEKLIPLPPRITNFEKEPLEIALHGGEDYQLLFTADRNNRTRINALGDVTRIGRTTHKEGRILLKRIDGREEEIKPGGFQHFRATAQDSE